uniref:Putative secreted protein n=1 Tax=Ixodes ricinus TaxID=34613 RepID=A0A6B0TY86_IXORI
MTAARLRVLTCFPSTGSLLTWCKHCRAKHCEDSSLFYIMQSVLQSSHFVNFTSAGMRLAVLLAHNSASLYTA